MSCLCHLELIQHFNFKLFCDFLRLQDEMGLRQDAENNLNAFRQVILLIFLWIHDPNNIYIQYGWQSTFIPLYAPFFA